MARSTVAHLKPQRTYQSLECLLEERNTVDRVEVHDDPDRNEWHTRGFTGEAMELGAEACALEYLGEVDDPERVGFGIWEDVKTARLA